MTPTLHEEAARLADALEEHCKGYSLTVEEARTAAALLRQISAQAVPQLDSMDIAVLRMPSGLALENYLSSIQFYGKVQELLDQLGVPAAPTPTGEQE